MSITFEVNEHNITYNARYQKIKELPDKIAINVRLARLKDRKKFLEDFPDVSSYFSVIVDRKNMTYSASIKVINGSGQSNLELTLEDLEAIKDAYQDVADPKILIESTGEEYTSSINGVYVDGSKPIPQEYRSAIQDQIDVAEDILRDTLLEERDRKKKMTALEEAKAINTLQAMGYKIEKA